MIRFPRFLHLLGLLLLANLAAWPASSAAQGAPPPPKHCPPTPQTDTGPFYRPGAAARGKIGSGYLLTGVVRSALDCSPIAAAKIEFWTTGPDGRYEDRWRATTFSDRKGRYRFETHFPGRYGTRPPHIHIVVAAPGFESLVTQQYPLAGKTHESFDLVMIPR